MTFFDFGLSIVEACANEVFEDLVLVFLDEFGFDMDVEAFAFSVEGDGDAGACIAGFFDIFEGVL